MSGQILLFCIRVPDVDFSPSKIQVITSNIYINLFDEVVVDILEDDRKRATTLHHRIEKRWLGKLTIPFSTLIIRQMVCRGFSNQILYNSPPVI